MKKIMVKCPFCNERMVYKNWFYWVLRTPIHWFNKRRIKCAECGRHAYVKGTRIS